MIFAAAQLAAISQAITPRGAPAEDGGALVVILFYLFAAAAVGGAIAAAAFHDLRRAGMGLGVTLAAVAGLYFILHAEFLAAIQLLVFAGGTLVAIFITHELLAKTRSAALRPPGSPRAPLAPAILLAAIVTVGLAFLMIRTPWQTGGPWEPSQTVGVEDIGRSLTSAHAGFLLPLELTSALFMSVLIGAAYLARERRPAPPPGPPAIKTLAPASAIAARRGGRR